MGARPIQAQSPFFQHQAQGLHQAFDQWHRPGGGKASARSLHQVVLDRLGVGACDDLSQHPLVLIVPRKVARQIAHELYVIGKPSENMGRNEPLEQHDRQFLVQVVIPRDLEIQRVMRQPLIQHRASKRLPLATRFSRSENLDVDIGHRPSNVMQ